MKGRCKMDLFYLYENFERCENYEDRQIIDEDRVLAYQKKKKITLDIPIYGGFVVLELSKLLMYKFYYILFEDKIS